MMNNKIHTFTDLNVWKSGHDLVLYTYKITKKFPKHEIFGLSSQMQRAAVSVTSNIAESFGRTSYKDKYHFFQISLGSIHEIHNQILIAKDLQYISEKECSKFVNLATSTESLCRGIMKSTKNFIR